jgi:hypothetical protein
VTDRPPDAVEPTVEAAAPVEPSDGRDPDVPEPRERRPLLERIGLAGIAAVLAILFGGVAAASWVGGEPFLAVMGAIGCIMTAWVGGLTLFRG